MVQMTEVSSSSCWLSQHLLQTSQDLFSDGRRYVDVCTITNLYKYKVTWLHKHYYQNYCQDTPIINAVVL